MATAQRTDDGGQPMPLDSWNDGAVKSAIVDFVARVTREGGPEYVPPAERVAVFDNDGTLWCEQPIQVQVFFVIDRVKAIAAGDPGLSERQPFKALLEKDFKTLLGLGKQALVELALATHAGMTDERFDGFARDWLAAATHPHVGRAFKNCAFRPQLELLALLRANDFKTYIVTGGGVDFVRAFSGEIYGVPREQVIGSRAQTRLDRQGGTVYVTRLAQLDSFNDGEAKPRNISQHIGRRPLLAFGNSDGDLDMLLHVRSGPGARLALLLHHDDNEREFAYDREFTLSPLSEALDKAADFDITVVSMKRDWKVVFEAL
jgi:phosphoserine phosphatase